MFAYIQHSGKQFKVQKGSTIIVDKLADEVGATIEVKDVPLIVRDNDEVVVSPQAVITATVEEHFRDEKITVFKFKPKKGYKRKKGHRQPYTVLKISDITIN